jgi:DnaJ family protein C protein 2
MTASTGAACPHIKAVAALDWPSTPLETTTVLCGGDSFLDYCLRRKALRNIRHGSSFLSLGSSSEEEEEAAERQRDLFSLSSKKLQKLTYYQVLEIPTHASPQVIKKGYHAACLLYHPDKTGRSEDDEVFLKVKAAFDTLSDSDKRKAYDSSELTFDDSIPQGGEAASDFYDIYGPVFERNLMFDAKLRENNGTHKAPLLGNDDTPCEKVHTFYEYWIHFDSWRDFSLKASLETENDLESADSRYEKRWMQKEIAKKSKTYKREEMARLNLLVERAMSADPRLKREKLRLLQEKQARQQAKKTEKEEEKQKHLQEQERLQAAKSKQEEKEKLAKASAKAIREKEKKQLRKSRQSFRKITMEAVESQNMLHSLDKINDDIELLCDKLTAQQLSRLTETLTSSHNNVLEAVQVHAAQTRKGVSEEEIEALQQRDAAREEEGRKARLAKQQRAMASSPWTKEEVSALAKAVKKYPPGGANRWEAIALLINNVCKPQDPRSKEECIEKYNQIANSVNTTTQQHEVKAQPSGGDNVWTDEQDALLQEGLKTFPATMDKNERWASIAKGVDGKSKKECVERFKAIRAAIKNK